VTRTCSLNATAASLAEKPDATGAEARGAGSERSDRSARAVPGLPQHRQGSRRARAAATRAAEQRDEFAPFDASVSRASTERIAHLVTAGDCCAARFQQLISQMGRCCRKRLENFSEQ
jgi:hypothetical protein